MTTSTGAPASGVAAVADGPVWHTLSADRVLEAEEVDEQSGLSSAEAAAHHTWSVVASAVRQSAR
jgi:hypothetical protein